MMGPLAYFVSVAEFFGGLGILSRLSASALIIVMIGAIVTVHAKNGFFSSKGGFEYNLALIASLLSVALVGPGRYALGRFLPLPKAREFGRPIPVLE